MLLILMMSRNQPYVAAVAVTVLFGVSGLITSSVNRILLLLQQQQQIKQSTRRQYAE
jgi:fucose permease